MKNLLLRLVAVSILVLSGSAFADTYPAVVSYEANVGVGHALCSRVTCPLSTVQSSLAAVCAFYVTRLNAGNEDVTITSNGSNGCIVYNAGVFSTSFTVIGSTTCPYSGTLSGSNCINATPCTAPALRGSTGECNAPVDCNPPETDNGFGICEVAECTSGEVLNGTTGVCQTPPTCAAAETYVNATNACKLLALPCPVHSHANSANDQCLSDPPLGCPIGQHDDGTYNCVADDAVRCNADQVKGYIFGIPQCIKKSNVDEVAKVKDDARATETAADSAMNAAKSAYDAAVAALAADPGNTTKQETVNTTHSEYVEKQGVADAAKTAADKAQQAQDTETLKAIAQNTKESNEREADKTAKNSDGCSSPPLCSGDPIQCAILHESFQARCAGNDTTITQGDVTNALGASPGSSLDAVIDVGSGSGSAISSAGYGLPTSCPVPITVDVLNKHLSLDFSPFCSLAEIIGYLTMITAYFISLRIVTSPQ